MTLGRWGKRVSWFFYMFLLYSLTTAYIAGGGPIILDVLHSFTGKSMPEWAGALPLLGIFGFFVYKGTRSVDYVNRILMFGLAVVYVIMAVFLTPHIDQALLRHVDLRYLVAGVSVVATSFGFHIIIPSLVEYMDRDAVKLRRVIIIGSLIPLIVYVTWELICLGIIPIEGPHGLREGFANGSNAVLLLEAFVANPAIAMVARMFSFFAIVTSFLGVSLSLSDSLSDTLAIKKDRKGRLILLAMTFLPPFAITLIDPRAFLSALEYAGAFGVVTLLGLMPALMVWSGRYVRHLSKEHSYRVFGGKPALLAAIGISVAIILLEVAIKLGWMAKQI
jgi:tyrosine-specific transport protein